MSFITCQIEFMIFDNSSLGWILNVNQDRTRHTASICCCCCNCCTAFCPLLSRHNACKVYGCYILIVRCPFNNLSRRISRCNISPWKSSRAKLFISIIGLHIQLIRRCYNQSNIVIFLDIFHTIIISIKSIPPSIQYVDYLI